jgi:DNA-binding SARP family transcriptional activator
MQAISSVRLRLLGRFAAFPTRTPDQPLSISSRKGCALLAYLAMQPEPTLTREQLATLLWGDRFDTQARQSLRQCLLSLRRDLEQAAPDMLAVDGELVRLNVQALSTDAREFAALAEEGGDPEHALGLYRGEFLAGFNLDVEPFDDWLRRERTRFAGIAARLLELQAEQSDERGNGEPALRACERLLAIDPLREDWQRLALTLTARYRGCDQAMARAKALVALLRSELDADPDPATAALISDIKRGVIAPASQTRNPTPEALAPRGAASADVAAPVPLAPKRAAATSARTPLEIGPAPAAPDWRLKILSAWPLAALACIVALAILVTRLWLLAPGHSVSASTGNQKGQLLTPATNVLIAKGWAAMNRGYTVENLTEAMACFNEAHRRDASLLAPMVGIAAVSINLVDTLLTADTAPHLELAEAFLQKALRNKPEDARTHHFLGRLHLTRGDYQAALKEFARALELNPNSPYTRAMMGGTLVRIDRASDGLEQIRNAIQLSPDSPAIGYLYVLAGEAELELGRTDSALEWLLRALTVLSSDDGRVHRALAATYALRGDDANAAKHASEFRRIVPQARIADLNKKPPARLREGLSLALALSNPNKPAAVSSQARDKHQRLSPSSQSRR